MLSKSFQTFLGIGDKEAHIISAALEYIFGEDCVGIDEYILKNPDVAERLKEFIGERRGVLASEDTKRIERYARLDAARLQALFSHDQ